MTMLLSHRQANFAPPVRIEAAVVMLPQEERKASAEPATSARPLARKPLPKSAVKPARPVEHLPSSVRAAPPPRLAVQHGGKAPAGESNRAPVAAAPSLNEQATPTSPTKPPGNEAGSTGKAGDMVANEGQSWNAYGQALSQLAARYKRYPALALQRGWQGQVRIAVTIAPTGELLAVEVRQSSGYAALDQQALAIVRRAQSELPLPSRPPGQTLTLMIPVNFSLATGDAAN